MATRKKKTAFSAKKKRAKSRPRKPAARTIQSGLSLDRKLDITGALLAIIGLLTLFALFSSGTGLAGIWLGIWSSWFACLH